MRLTALLRRRWFVVSLAGLLAVAALTWLTVRALDHTPAPRPQPVIVWTFEQPERGAIISTPVVTAECVYVAAIHDSALAPSGIVYCLDRRAGRVRWRFDNDGHMLHTISSPCLADGRLYVGEGMHGNNVCHMYCLDAATSRKFWQFETGGHIESSPCVAEGLVVFGSGDEGIYGLDAVSGKRRWQFEDHCHVDVSPAVSDGRVYAGSGVSERHRLPSIFCLSLQDGRPLWRKRTELPVWGSPLVDGGQVFFGTGNGRLTQRAEPPEKPAGALLCVDAQTRNIVWTYPVEDAIFARSTVDAQRVYFGARDGCCYCLDRRDGRRLWQRELGQPIVTQPALVDGRLYVVASGGMICCLAAESGQTVWSFDLAQQTQTRPQLLSSPVVVAEEPADGMHHLLFLGTELRSSIRSAAVLYCLRD